MQKRGWKSVAFATIAAAIVLSFSTVGMQAAQAQSFNVIYNFTGGLDGTTPNAALTLDNAGNLIGTTVGSSFDNGNVFALTRTTSGWNLNVLYGFKGGTDGSRPLARIVIGPDANLYSTTYQGGSIGAACDNGCGTVFSLAKSGSSYTETVVHRFAGGGTEGYSPVSSIAFDRYGTIYGTTPNVDGGAGNAYYLSKACPRCAGPRLETVVYRFYGTHEGVYPQSSLTLDKNGSERESVTHADLMRVLVFGNSGYTPWDEGVRLEQSTGVAWV